MTLKVCPDEDCSDGIDNDDDGLVDCDDPDCAPIATIINNLNDACVNENFSFSATDVGAGASYSWVFGTNSTPSTATGIGAHSVSYSDCGIKEIILTVSLNGCDVIDTIEVTVTDDVDPTFTVPTDVTLYLDSSCEIDSIPAITGFPTNVNDDCTSSPQVTYTNDFTNLDECNSTGSFTRQWTVTDNCGNATTLNQVISVLDTISPTFTIPADITLFVDASCSVDTTTSGAGTATAQTDNCGTTTTTYVDVINTTAGCASGYEIERTWSVEDDCGNVTTNLQTITVLDTIAPIVVFPNDTTLYLDASCMVDTTITSSGDVSVVNNCGTTATNYVDVINTTAGCTSGYEVERTWTVTDDCGNVTTCLLYTSPSPRDATLSRMPSSA